MQLSQYPLIDNAGVFIVAAGTALVNTDCILAGFGASGVSGLISGQINDWSSKSGLYLTCLPSRSATLQRAGFPVHIANRLHVHGILSIFFSTCSASLCYILVLGFPTTDANKDPITKSLTELNLIMFLL